MKKQTSVIIYISLVFIICCFGIACSNKTPDPAPVVKNNPPVIVSLSIDSGTYNTPVTINGTDFGKDIASNLVMFNGHEAVLTSATTTKLVAKVPDNAGNGNITVTTGGVKATGPIFRYINPVIKPDSLFITSLSPDSGTYNTAVVLTGGGFSTTLANNKLLFNGKSATISAATATTLTTKVPQDAGTGKVTLQVNSVTATGPVFKYLNAAPQLAINSLSVTNGITGTAVVITGSGFSTTIANNKLYFNGKAAVVTTATANKLTTTVPAGATTGPVTVTVNNVTAQGPVFTVNVPLAVTKLSAYSGIYRAAITITGTGFSDDMSVVKVYVNGKYADVLSSSTTQILFGVPLSAGSGIIKVVVNGVSVNGPAFTYILSPVSNVTTIAGSDANGNPTNFLAAPMGVAVDSLGNVYVGDTDHNNIKKIAANGSLTTFAGGTAGANDGKGSAAGFNSPMNVATDVSGNVYVADAYNRAIRKITVEGTVTTIYTGQYQPSAVTVDRSGNVYFSGGTTPTMIMKMTPAKVVTVLAGSNNTGYKNGIGSAALFGGITGLASDAVGNIYVADALNNVIRKVTTSGKVSTLAGTSKSGSANGNVSQATFDRPTGVAVDAGGNVYVADYHNWLIRKISAGGVVTTVIGKPTSLTKDIDGNVDFAVLPDPFAIAVDASGKYIYVADQTTSRIRKITVIIE